MDNMIIQSKINNTTDTAAVYQKQKRLYLSYFPHKDNRFKIQALRSIVSYFKDFQIFDPQIITTHFLRPGKSDFNALPTLCKQFDLILFLNPARHLDRGRYQEWAIARRKNIPCYIVNKNFEILKIRRLKIVNQDGDIRYCKAVIHKSLIEHLKNLYKTLRSKIWQIFILLTIAGIMQE